MKDEILKTLFICSSPYTVFNSMNYLLNNINSSLDNSDIVIFHKTKTMSKISSDIKKSNVFKTVFDYKDFQRSKFKTIISTLIMIFPRTMFRLINMRKTMPELPENYDVIISQNRFFLILFARLNKGAQCYLIEDGLGSYIGRVSDPTQRTKLMRIAEKILSKVNIKVEYVGQYVYRPELISGNRLRPYQLPVFNNKQGEIIKNVFSHTDNNLYSNYEVILFGDAKMQHSLTTDTLDANTKSKYDLYKNNILSSIPKKNVVYRAHPVEKDIKENLGEINTDRFNNIWEIECYEKIHEDHILISYFSTAVITPKVLYGKEPYIIFLYNLASDYSDRVEEITEYISSFKLLYSKPEKIIIVNNIKQLNNKIEEITKRFENM